MKAILVVEDNDDIREAVVELLLDEGYDVCQAENGKVALERLDEMHGRPCLLLLDLMMPEMDGAELLRELHANEQLASLPVIVLSAGGEAGDAPEASMFVRKPVDPEQLLRLVAAFCEKPAGQRPH